MGWQDRNPFQPPHFSLFLNPELETRNPKLFLFGFFGHDFFEDPELLL